MDFFSLLHLQSPCSAKSNHELIFLNELPSALLSKVVYLWEKCESCFELFSSMDFLAYPHKFGAYPSPTTTLVCYLINIYGRNENLIRYVRNKNERKFMMNFLLPGPHWPFTILPECVRKQEIWLGFFYIMEKRMFLRRIYAYLFFLKYANFFITCILNL